ncbi:MAG: hypothetical protein Q8Q04_03260 [archaeon]|nr:hypothetical protein [archaeon]
MTQRYLILTKDYNERVKNYFLQNKVAQFEKGKAMTYSMGNGIVLVEQNDLITMISITVGENDLFQKLEEIISESDAGVKSSD